MKTKKILGFVMPVVLLFSLMLPLSVSAASYENWKQYDSQWGNIKLGSQSGTEMKSIGCRVTSIAIVCAKLGLVDDKFNPGTFVQDLKEIGAFTSGGAMNNWTDPEKVVPGLEVPKDNKVKLSGTNAEKAAIISKYCKDGYACTIYTEYTKNNGKISQHYVAANYVDGDKVYIYDPGSGKTELFSAYGNRRITSIRFFKRKDGKSITITDEGKLCKHSSYNSYGKCKSCGTEYSMKISSMSATTYQVVKNDVPVRNRPYSPEKITKYLSKGTKVTVVASGKNSAGNLWYKLSDGSWIYSKNLETVVKQPDSTLDINVTQYPSTINQGKSFGLRGYITSNYNITSVKGYILDSNGNTVQSTTDTPNSKSMDIRSASLNQDLLFNKLSTGTYKLKVVVKDSSGESLEWGKSFTVKSETSTSSNNTNTSTSNQTIADGTYVIATKLNTNYVLDISDASKDNGANLQLWKSNGTAAQTFRVTHIGNGYYQIVNTNSGKAIDVQNGDTAAGTNVWQYQINNTDAQLWKIVSAGSGSYYIIGKGSGLYLDVDNAYTDYGTNVKIFDRNDAYDAQKWIFTKTSSSSSSSSSSTSIRFELESVPKGNLPYGKSFSLKGWFRSDSAIVEARAYMLDANKNIVMQSDKASSTTSNYKIQGYKLDKAMKFNELSPGGYYLKYYVRDADGDTATWISDMFYIVR